MKFYLASAFALKGEVERVRQRLSGLGHEVPDVWWHVDLKELPAPDERSYYAIPEVKVISMRHWKSIAACDALILVAPPDRTHKFTGANIEVGFAIGRGIPVFSVGMLERSGMYGPVVQCRDMDELVRTLRVFAMESITATFAAARGG